MSNNHSFHIILILISMLVSSCSGHYTKVAVEPGHLLKGKYMNIHSPKTEGWFLINSSPTAIEFARQGFEKHQTFAAQLLLFPLSTTDNKDDFHSIIKSDFINNTNIERYEPIESSFIHSDKRSYPCIEITSTSTDTKAQISLLANKALLFEIRALYCRHPVLSDTGFGIIFSHRGENPYPLMTPMANSFIDGTQVPGH